MSLISLYIINHKKAKYLNLLIYFFVYKCDTISKLRHTKTQTHVILLTKHKLTCHQ